MAGIATMPANHLFPPGPCEIAVRTGLSGPDSPIITGNSSGYEFLGTTREGGRAQEILYTGNIPGDYSGSDGMPADIRLSGKGIVIVCQVQNFNPFAMGSVKSRYYGGVNGVDKAGLVDFCDVGGLLIQEGRYISICIRSLNAYGMSPNYPDNEAGIWVPFCFPSGEMGWDYAAREQVYSLTFLGVTYMNMGFTTTPVAATVGPASIDYNAGILYSTDPTYISTVWGGVVNPTS